LVRDVSCDTIRFFLLGFTFATISSTARGWV